jgi:hypothetical protein
MVGRPDVSLIFRFLKLKIRPTRDYDYDILDSTQRETTGLTWFLETLQQEFPNLRDDLLPISRTIDSLEIPQPSQSHTSMSRSATIHPDIPSRSTPISRPR